MLRGRLEDARVARQSALALRRKAGRRSAIAASLINLGVIHFIGGSYEEAKGIWREALAVHEETGNAEGIGAWYLPECRRYLAEAALGAGDLDRAEELARAGLEGAGDRGSIRLRGSLLAALARIACSRGQLEEAGRRFDEALEALASSGDSFELAVALVHRARFLGEAGEAAAAREGLERARALLQEVGNTTWIGRVEAALAAFERRSL